MTTIDDDGNEKDKKMSDADMRQLLKQSQDIVTTLSQALKNLQPMAQFGQAVIDDNKYYSMKSAAQKLHEYIEDNTGIQIGRTKLFKALRAMGILSSYESNWNEPEQRFVNSGYFKTKIRETNVGMKSVTLVTGRGLEWLQKKLMEYYGHE